MTENDKKICKICYMEIAAKAKKCPYCLSWQNKMSTITFHPLLGVCFFIAIMVGTGLFFNYLFEETMFPAHKKFSECCKQIVISRAEMKFGSRISCENAKIPTVAIIGVIKNDSDTAWTDIVFEAQMFDKKGKMIDTMQKNEYSFVVPANGSISFKLSQNMEFPQENYHTFKIRVVTAKDCEKKF